MRLRSILALWIGLLAIHPALHSAVSQAAGEDKASSVVIVELFTSEGCSSCPPADALLRQINLKQTNAGQLIVGISEHVTYWNNLGWKDPYSLSVFTERQSAYASLLSSQGPYTPEMIVNGRDQFVGSDSSALTRALQKEATRNHLDLRILSSTLSSAGVNVKFSLSGEGSRRLDIIAVLTDDVDRSNVLRGENGGRELQHVSVARSLTRVATVRGDVEQTVHIALPEGFQPGTGSGHHIILFAQEPHRGSIDGAATIAL